MSADEAWPHDRVDTVYTSWREWLDETAPDDDTVRPRRKKTRLLRTLARREPRTR